jgi:hypothetical protein
MMEMYVHGFSEYCDKPSVRALDEHHRVRVNLKPGIFVTLSPYDAERLGKTLLAVSARLNKRREAEELASRQMVLALE